jgi:hypothetical protein
VVQGTECFFLLLLFFFLQQKHAKSRLRTFISIRIIPMRGCRLEGVRQ